MGSGGTTLRVGSRFNASMTAGSRRLRTRRDIEGGWCWALESSP